MIYGENPTDKYVGLEEREAEAQAVLDGLMVRITGRDGEYFPVTADLRSNRVNFVIDQGKVLIASIG